MEFRRISNLPPYVFTIINSLKIEARRNGVDVVDLGFGNPDIPSPSIAVEIDVPLALVQIGDGLADLGSSARPSPICTSASGTSISTSRPRSPTPSDRRKASAI
jgi:hypothetical protein